MLVHRIISPTVQHLKCLILPSTSSLTAHRTYAKANVGIPSLGKKATKVKGPTIEKKKLSVETDATKLVNYVCGTCLTKTGKDIELQDDSQYPEWLWSLNTGKPPPLEEIDPDTDYYWIRVRKIAMRRSLRLMRLRKF